MPSADESTGGGGGETPLQKVGTPKGTSDLCSATA